MKIDLSAALEALKGANFVRKDEYAIVRVSLKDNLSEKNKPSITWDLYAYSKDGKRSTWIMNSNTFDEALIQLEKELQPTDRFIEE